MRSNRGPLGPAEITLVIQSAIEDLHPQQVLLRDRILTLCGGGEMTPELAHKYVVRLGPEKSAVWNGVLWSAKNQGEALAQLAVDQARRSADDLGKALAVRILA